MGSHLSLALGDLDSAQDAPFVDCPSAGSCVMVFSGLDWRSVLLGMETRGQAPSRQGHLLAM